MKHAYVLNDKKASLPFDPLMLHESIVNACLSVRAHEGEAHSTAQRVCQKVIEWLAPKEEVTSRDIRRVTSKHLSIYHPEAAYMYSQMDRMI
jgi:hypothetical protein